MKKRAYILWAIIIAMFIVAGYLYVKKVQAPMETNKKAINNVAQLDVVVQKPITNGQEKVQVQTDVPLSSALSRTTKKPFGIFITPKTSPVQPERFAGYHTGTDLETTPAEQDVGVPVKVLCDGKLLVARTASGYGGVAVQSCILDEQKTTVVYGHINLASVNAKIGDQLKTGDFLANLGVGFSMQTDSERKHLHLGIHKGTGINILGYVQSKSELSAWIDPAEYLN